MPHPAPARKSFSDRTTLYQEITDKIVTELEQGRVPWVQPWAGAPAPLGLPKNAATGRSYSGINILILWLARTERGFTGQSWLTFRQALKLGAHVRKGERGITVVYADRFIPYRERTRAAETGDEPEAIPFLKRFTVFNADQCEDLPADIAPPAGTACRNLILPQAEALIRATGADIRIGGDRAFYVPSADYIQVPPPSAFFEPINFHRTVCHELGHWSGAAHRLNRDLSGGFGSSSYAREELVAEMTGAFVCAALSIVPTVRHADYLASWLDVLREDNRAIIRREFLAARRRADTEVLAPAGTRIAFTGGADCNDHTRIWDALDKIRTKHPDMVLLHGGSPRGAERAAACWADHRKVPQVVFKPDWTRDRNAAPFKRNDRMLEALPIGVVVFPGSGIAANLADKAKKLGIPTWRFDQSAPAKAEPQGGAA